MNLNWWNDEICQITLDELTIFNFPSQITLLAFEVWSQFRTRKLHLTPAAQVMRLANFPRWMFWCARFLEQTFTLDCYIHSYFSAKQRHVSWTKKTAENWKKLSLVSKFKENHQLVPESDHLCAGTEISTQWARSMHPVMWKNNEKNQFLFLDSLSIVIIDRRRSNPNVSCFAVDDKIDKKLICRRSVRDRWKISHFTPLKH